MRMLIVVAVVAGAFALGFAVRAMTESAGNKCQPVAADWTASKHTLVCPAGTVPSIGHGWKLAGTDPAGAGLNYVVFSK
jgi:hypothetical protein